MADEDLQLPPLPDLFPEKLKRIDPEGCEEVQRKMKEWLRKLANKLRE